MPAHLIGQRILLEKNWRMADKATTVHDLSICFIAAIGEESSDKEGSWRTGSAETKE